MHYKVLTSDDAAEFSKLLSNGQWVVLFYADWCGHCNAMKPEWNKAVTHLSTSKDMNIADVNSNIIEELTPKPEIEGFPTIKMYHDGKVIARFEDERSADKITAFANSNSVTSVSNSSSSENTRVSVNADRLENLVKKVAILKGKNRKSSTARKMKKKSIIKVKINAQYAYAGELNESKKDNSEKKN